MQAETRPRRGKPARDSRTDRLDRGSRTMLGLQALLEAITLAVTFDDVAMVSDSI